MMNAKFSLASFLCAVFLNDCSAVTTNYVAIDSQVGVYSSGTQFNVVMWRCGFSKLYKESKVSAVMLFPILSPVLAADFVASFAGDTLHLPVDVFSEQETALYWTRECTNQEVADN